MVAALAALPVGALIGRVTGGGTAHMRSREAPLPLGVSKQMLADHNRKKD